MERIDRRDGSRLRWYAGLGFGSLLLLAALQQLARVEGMPQPVQLAVFYLALPGWTLFVASVEVLDTPPAVSFGWLMITGFSSLVWFLAATSLVEGVRWTRHCVASRRSPGSLRRFLTSFTVAAAVATALFVPFESTIVPEWRVNVTDGSGHRVGDAHVRQVWQHHSVELEGHSQDRRTQPDGMVLFPRRTVSASLAHRVVGPMLNVAQTFVHAGIGARASVLAWTDEGEGHLDYQPPGPPPENLVLKDKR